jgi:uncharacterized membrane protein
VQKLISFLKTSFLGGALVVLPAWLALLLFIKALIHLEVIVKPVSTHLPKGVGHPLIIAILLMIALCLLVGAGLHTAFGRQAKEAVENMVLEKVPGYTTLRSVAEQVGDLEENHGFKPALIDVEDALAPGFIVEEHPGGKCTVFIPSSPTPMAGNIYIIDQARVHPVDVPVATMFKCITKWGAGTGDLFAALSSTKKKTVDD